MASVKQHLPHPLNADDEFETSFNESLSEHRRNGLVEEFEDKARQAVTSSTNGCEQEAIAPPSPANAPFFEGIERVRTGVSYETLERLQKGAGLNQVEVATVVGITERTLTRRKQEGRLTATESDRVDRIARLLELATKVLEDEGNARLWMHQPNRGLGGKTPLDLLDTDRGVRAVEDVLMRIEYGNYG
jgi:putative toxin-antitoxin system antitoxin component (TIGR02293 family)